MTTIKFKETTSEPRDDPYKSSPQTQVILL